MSRRNRLIIISFIVIALLLAASYVVAGAAIYNRLSSATPRCEASYITPQANTPAAFSAEGSALDMTPYVMPAYEEVSFSSRGENLNLSGWFVPASDATATVVLVHGLNGCKRAPSVLLPAGMLHRAGFNVLMVDLRDHGDSQIEDGRFAGGTEEYRDVLGAWDWLVNENGVEPQTIGLFGTSLGAASVMIATGQEPRVAATWEDSSYADIQVAISDFLVANGVPSFFAPAAPLVGRFISGDDISAPSPLDQVSNLNGRPIFIAHGDADSLLPVHHAHTLIDAIPQAESWIAPGSAHIAAMFDYTDTYEQKLIAFFQKNLMDNNHD
jgi:fermentation-respiration switch protein FrsA (DUF1100 family)